MPSCGHAPAAVEGSTAIPQIGSVLMTRTIPLGGMGANAMFGSDRMGTLAGGARKVDVSTEVTQAPHETLGLTPDHLLRMHRSMLTARLIDEAALRQNRMGRAPFVVPVSGHEGCQIGTAWPMRRGTDIWVPYYRDLGVVLVAGMTPEQVFLGIFSKATDP